MRNTDASFWLKGFKQDMLEDEMGAQQGWD